MSSLQNEREQRFLPSVLLVVGSLCVVCKCRTIVLLDVIAYSLSCWTWAKKKNGNQAVLTRPPLNLHRFMCPKFFEPTMPTNTRARGVRPFCHFELGLISQLAHKVISAYQHFTNVLRSKMKCRFQEKSENSDFLRIVLPRSYHASGKCLVISRAPLIPAATFRYYETEWWALDTGYALNNCRNN